MNRRLIIIPVVIFTLLAMLAGILLCGCGLSKNKVWEEPLTDTSFALDTFISVTLYAGGDEAVLRQSLEKISSYETVFSNTREDSELYQINHRKPGQNDVEVSDDMAFVIQKALQYCEMSQGAFDITTEPVNHLWDFHAEEPVLPDAKDVERELKKVDFHKVSMEGNILHFASEDTQIDLGAIAKGYIADQAKEFLKEKGVTSAIINLGGNVLCLGEKPDGKDFTIGLQMPFADRNETSAALKVNELSVVSSGVYERHFIIDGKNYHHILNPSTGYPYDNGLVQVSILTKNSIDADALSTTCFALGAERGVALLDGLEGTYGYFILDDYSVVYSKGAQEQVKAN